MNNFTLNLKTMLISFSKVSEPNGWLSNMAPYPVIYDGKEWRTTEALFQALRYDDPAIREIIRNEKSPMSAKMVAKKYKDKRVVEPLSEKDIENMKLCVKLKIDQHPKIQMLIKATGSRKIYENIGSRSKKNDLFWGAKLINGTWEGNNMMGKIWMEMRGIY
jgi:N-glycosidase YbiA